MSRLFIGLGLALVGLAGAGPAHADLRFPNLNIASCQWRGQIYVEGATVVQNGVTKACSHAGQWVDYVPTKQPIRRITINPIPAGKH